jgi:DNA-binding SARP family transcriptional activator
VSLTAPTTQPELVVPGSERLILVTLGSVALRLDDGTALFEIGKPAVLATYLACAPERRAAREHLVDLLWGDVEPEAGKHALRQTVWYLKKRLGDRQLVAGTGDILTLVGRIDCDRDALLTAAEHGDAEAVVRLYTGDFFPGFAAPGGAEFERWADAERHRFRSVFCRSAELLARQWMSSARMKDAQALARRVRDLDPLREAGWRLLFETIVAGRDAIAASLEVEGFERLVAREGIDPEPATRSLLRLLRQAPSPNDDHASAGPRGLVAELVGREGEFSRIIAAWDAARGGRSSHVHVLAGAGLGKTRLLTDVHARLRASRARATFTRATLGARDIPYGLVGELAHALASLPGASGISPGSARTLVALNPTVSSFFPSIALDARDDPDDALRRRTAALRELITVLAEEQPLAVFVDDLQWADASSRQVLAGIYGTLGAARVLLITAGRPTADITHIPEFTDTIHVGPLAHSAVVALLASIATLPSEPWAEQFQSDLWHATGGSPLLVLETLQLALEGGSLELVDGEWCAPRPHELLAAMQAGGALRHRVERLDRRDRWLLTTLAVAGSPLPAGVVAAAVERTTDETTLALVALEQRGLVSRHDTLWSPSHDEIAAMTIELATDSAVRAAGKAVGRAIVGQHASDLRSLRQAGALLDHAGDQEGLAHAFNLFARAAREKGDRRPNLTLARDFIGDRMQALTRWLVRSLPLTHRLGLYSVRRQIALAASVVIVPLAVSLVRSTLNTAEPAPDAILVVGSLGRDSIARLYRVPIRGSGLTVGQVIQPSVKRRPDWSFRADQNLTSFVPLPGGDAWLVDRIVADSGGIDIFEVSARGERRLTNWFGDDQAATPSPDGRLLAFNTAHWDERSRYDIGILDRQTGQLRRLTSTGDSDMSPSWSPDGTRIAFTRFYWDGRKTAACVIDVDGSNERCLNVAGRDLAPLRAWHDPGHLLVRIGDKSPYALTRVEIATGVIDTITQVLGPPLPSPDGRWIAVRASTENDIRQTYQLFPTDAPNRAIEFDLSRMPPGQPLLSWAVAPGRSRFVDRIRIDTGWGSAIVGIPHRLLAEGQGPTGSPAEIGRVTWRSADTTLATIDSLGDLVGKRSGEVDIELRAGGWRSVTQPVVIRAPSVSVLFRENWRGGIGDPWRAYGYPMPRVDSTPDGAHWMMNAGDGSHSSGVYTRGEYSTTNGLALDFRVAAAISDEQWQMISVQLNGSLDRVALATWDHKTGSPPRAAGEYQSCELTYPGGKEGSGWGDSITVGRMSDGLTAGVPAAFRKGKPFDGRIQLFPDGRCGVAINGVPIFVYPPRTVSKPVVRAVLSGNSMWTKVLVGELTLRSGVPNDIDWSKASPRSHIPEQEWRAR